MPVIQIYPGASGVAKRWAGGSGVNQVVSVTPNAHVQAMITAGWSGSLDDIARLNTLSESIMAVSSLSSAKAANKLFVAPFVGSSEADRRRCLFHPSGAGYQMTSTISSSNNTSTGFAGDGTGYIDTGWSGSGLGWQDNTVLFHGRRFEAMYCDRAAWVVYGGGTALNGETGIKHDPYYSTFRSGCTYSFGNGGYCSSRAFQAGTIGSVCKGNAADKQKAWRDGHLTSNVTDAGVYGQLGQSTNTFKLLGTPSANTGTRAEAQTVVLAPGLMDADYIALQSAVASFNSYRRTYAVSAVSSPTEIWVVAGQSNAGGNQVVVGASQNRTGDLRDEPHVNLLQWIWAAPNVSALDLAAFGGTFVQASMPVCADPGSGVLGVGPHIAMGQRLLEINPSRRIGLICASRGASSFSAGDWNPGNPTYENMLSLTNAAIASGAVLRGFVWNQGEGDTSLNDAAYLAAWSAMMNDFRARVTGGWPAQARVILGQIANPAGWRDNANNLIVAAYPESVYVTGAMAGVTSLSDADRYDDASKIHYSAIAQRLMGVAYANAA